MIFGFLPRVGSSILSLATFPFFRNYAVVGSAVSVEFPFLSLLCHCVAIRFPLISLVQNFQFLGGVFGYGVTKDRTTRINGERLMAESLRHLLDDLLKRFDLAHFLHPEPLKIG